MSNVNITALSVFVVLFLLITVMGFFASGWRSGGEGNSLETLDEWGLGGRKFGSWITWFLVGGDLYTAYTFVAVPALIFGAGAIGFFALPYTIVLYPLVFLPLVRMWSVSRRKGYVTPADFVRGRYESPTLALLIAITGIVATMPYIALQLVGLEAVLRTIGLNGSGIAGHLPLFIAFLVLALYTYKSGLRAPALIAFVKDGLIYGKSGHRIDPAHRQQPAAVRHAGTRLRAGPVPLPALRDRNSCVQGSQRHQAEHGGTARVLVPTRAAGAAGLRGDRGQGQAFDQRRDGQAGLQHHHPGAVQQ